MKTLLILPAITINLFVSSLSISADPVKVADLHRKGNEIIVCGRPIYIGTPVITWLDPGGYDAYSPDRLVPEYAPKNAPLRIKRGFGERNSQRLSAKQRDEIKEKGWELEALRTVVDQFVIHYDACGTSRYCFYKLHDERSLSIHFMLDLDGTIYQTLDLKENAWHATKANGRSIGIEIANVGAVDPRDIDVQLGPWYKKSTPNETVITIPDEHRNSGIRDRSLILKPSRPNAVTGTIHGRLLGQYDLTPQQYESLIKLTAVLHTIFPKISLDYPRGKDGKLIPTVLPDADYDRYQGVLGHFHIQTNKTDPGPAFEWDKVMEGARSAAVPVEIRK